jgi:hypothetical protein
MMKAVDKRTFGDLRDNASRLCNRGGHSFFSLAESHRLQDKGTEKQT